MEQAVAEARHRALGELREQVQREKAKFEAEIVDLYRRRLKEVRACLGRVCCAWGSCMHIAYAAVLAH